MLVATSIVVGLLYLFYKYWISYYSYWEKRGIPYYPPKFPYGSDENLVKMKAFRSHTLDKMYQKFASQPMFGIFILMQPSLVLKDPELIQLVLTKEFSHFRDRNIIKVHGKVIINHNLVFLDGEMWRALRMKLAPTFTSGKLKNMFPFFVSCAENFSSFLMLKVGSKVNIKELTSAYAGDVILSAAFGLKTDVASDSVNKLRQIGVKANNWNFSARLKLAVLKVFPGLSSLLPIRFLSSEDENYVINLVKNVVEERERSGDVRNDFIDLLIQLKNKGYLGEEEQGFEKPFEMTYGLMAAQCFLFFLAGFDTPSAVQSNCLYELALHQDIQSKLIKEIDEKIGKNDITYKAVQEMEYLDMVISETSRKYPPQGYLHRCCTKSITFPGGQKIEEGMTVVIPVWSLQHDPQYFPDPHKFDPERFSQENKHSIIPYTYLPFGEGPRICIGMRFGQLQAKVGIVALLRKFRVEACEDTKVPLVFRGTALVAAPTEPIILKLLARS